MNAQHKSWDKGKNPRGKATVRFALRTNLRVTVPPHPSYTSKGRAGSSKPDLLLDLEEAHTSQPHEENWAGSSDHTQIVYTLRNTNLNAGKRRVSKTMLNNRKNRAEAQE